MNASADALEYAAGQKDGQGFGGVIASPLKKKLVLHWRGELTPAAKAAIADSPVPVVVKPALHTGAELSRASGRVVRLAESAGVQLVKVVRPQDGSGLRATVEGDKAEAARLRKAVASLDVPVTVTPGGVVATKLADPARMTDPGAGGAAMVSAFCSTAFAVQYGGVSSMLTASHCFHNNDKLGEKERERYSIGPDGQPVARPFGAWVSPLAKSGYGTVDVAVLDQRNGTRYRPEIWRGGSTETPSFDQSTALVTDGQRTKAREPARNGTPAREGNIVCQSGARSGEICNLEVVERHEDYTAFHLDPVTNRKVTTYYKFGWMAVKRPTDGSLEETVAGRQGDSGGPVVASTGQFAEARIGETVTAVGIVSSSHGRSFSCPENHQRKCFKAITFVGIDDALNHLDKPTDLLLTDAADPTVRKTKNFRGEPPAPATTPHLQDGHRVELLNREGVALAYDPTIGTFDGLMRGHSGTGWEMSQAPNGGWHFINVDNPTKVFGEAAHIGLDIVPLEAGYVHIRLQGGCLQLTTILAPGTVAHPSVEPCDTNSPHQGFRLAPVSDSTSDPAAPVPPSQWEMSVPPRTPTPRAGLAVMPLGDSITLGVGSTTRTGYRHLLGRRLAGTTDALRFVGSMRDADGTRHEGHSGWRIDQLQADIGPWLTEAKPNVVLLHIGTNDMDRDHQVSTAPQRLGALIDQIHTASPDTAVVVASLVPATEPAVQARVTAYNRAIPGIVADRAARGYRITQVSMDSLTTADLNDTLHPNNSGYEKMTESFLGGIATLSRNGWISEKIDVKPLPPRPTATAGDYNIDINGDGRTDYLAVDDNGAVRAWTNTANANGTVKWTDQGYIASGSSAWTGDQVRFADIGGDARADYLVMEPNGAVRAFVNTGGDGRGGWQYQGYIASGSTTWTGDQVRFADIGGDARADYLIVQPNGATRAFVNTADPATGAVKWTDQGTIASGSTTWNSAQVRFANVGGDARADYLIVQPNGAVRAFVNQGGDGRGGWDDRGTVATGSSAWTGDQVRFADISGDGLADCLVLADNGAVRAFFNTVNPATGAIKWTDQGTVATGVGVPGNRVRI
ncbi:GDSL-type esterase/lipase family protein [Streptomyces jumonjinensis]|uniref:GDSL-type esterase/lipase family protein n=2 Tax=Streptomyces jumonjinensis TaxID=1945 RepID=UPI00378A9717